MAATQAEHPQRRPHRPEPIFNLQTLDQAIGHRGRPMNLPLSLLMHALALVELVVVPALTPSDLPVPKTSLRAFFVEPALTVQPPPPPPPALRAPLRRPVEVRPTPSHELVAPPETAVGGREKGLDLGLEGGVPDGMPGGVEGGVDGGIVGGIIGDLPQVTAAPPVEPVRIGGLVRPPRRINYVAPEYPVLAQRARMRGVVIVEAIIGADGKVKEAKILRGIPMLDEAALTAVRRWVYTPTLIRGVPAPVVMAVTVTFDLTN
jgi:protein TonB